ncbi:TetR/AcrR family transcriptional repressor of nem operon [Streptomyces aurantiacus]|uniref:TetR/AcrR family transcriptional regulator n=1 Tax=Streptomyces aurantiacus TaxID=47760 RepID=UPI002792DB90|nr:TetR/AcrR family transcriptional regulator [Streptomyces aurantiacus]MDQ0779030.1 TetR/AcrR family transcriptional repressor of nem operon [Streptomyces aurantiacus]
MGRASQAQAAEHREQLVAAASRLFREQGFQVSLAELTSAVGLTTGGFYRHFESKDALLGEATAHAFQELRALLNDFEAAHSGDHGAGRTALIDYYLSPGHRDDAAHGCPVSGLNATVSHQPEPSQAKRHYVEGVQKLADWLESAPSASEQAPTDGAPGRAAAQVSDEAYATLCTMVGALVLARATNGSAVSERILTSARGALAAADE